MKLLEFKNHLVNVSEITFVKPDGNIVPKHFHITEIGQIDKKFIDCGGTIRNESVISVQLWESVDVWHRLEPQKLHRIIELSEEKLHIGDFEIEVEYQVDTIGKYNLDFKDNQFLLLSKNTTCLASDACGVTNEIKKNVNELVSKASACCSAESNCC